MVNNISHLWIRVQSTHDPSSYEKAIFAGGGDRIRPLHHQEMATINHNLPMLEAVVRAVTVAAANAAVRGGNFITPRRH